jgi:NADP-dependent 3-hydroxy acid dehydrogenase YdfG
MTFARAALPHLRGQGGGHLIQFSSIGKQAAFPFVSVYNATKWAMEGFYEALGQEVAKLAEVEARRQSSVITDAA